MKTSERVSHYETNSLEAQNDRQTTASSAFIEQNVLTGESVDWVASQGLEGIGSATRLQAFISDIENAPDLDASASSEVVRIAANTGDKNTLAAVLARYSTEAATEEQLNAYEHTPEVKALIDSEPNVALFMSRERIIGVGAGENQGSIAPSVLEAFDQTDSEEVREALKHHSEVLLSEDAEPWAKNISYAMLRLNVVESGIASTKTGVVSHHGTAYKPSDNRVGNIDIPLATPLPHVGAEQGIDAAQKKLSEMSEDEKRAVLSDEFLQAHPDLAEVGDIALGDLRHDRQEAVVSAALIGAIEKSHDSRARAAATARNIELAHSGAFLQPGDLVHTTRVGGVDLILDGGLVAGELIGQASASDSYPLNVDFNRVEPEDVKGDFDQQITAATAGFHRDVGDQQNITFIVSREHDFTDRPANMDNSDHKHRLAFAAVPSTEIKGIVLTAQQNERSQDIEVKVLEAALQAPVYYPVVSVDGELRLTPEEYAAKSSQRLGELKSRPNSREETESTNQSPKPPTTFTVPDIGAF